MNASNNPRPVSSSDNNPENMIAFWELKAQEMKRRSAEIDQKLRRAIQASQDSALQDKQGTATESSQSGECQPAKYLLR